MCLYDVIIIRYYAICNLNMGYFKIRFSNNNNDNIYTENGNRKIKIIGYHSTFG